MTTQMNLYRIAFADDVVYVAAAAPHAAIDAASDERGHQGPSSVDQMDSYRWLAAWSESDTAAIEEVADEGQPVWLTVDDNAAVHYGRLAE